METNVKKVITSKDNIKSDFKSFIENEFTYSPIRIEVPKDILQSYTLLSTLPSWRHGNEIILFPTSIKKFCSHESCGKIMNFTLLLDLSPIKFGESSDKNEHNLLIEYQCKNCESIHAIPVNISIAYSETSICFTMAKFGQYPPESKNVPTEITKLFNQLDGDSQEEIKKLYSNGRICEGGGRGIGAFAYYRQIVEILREKLFNSLIEALKNQDADERLISEYEKAKSERQFDKAMQHIKKDLPPSFKIEGQNPISLLFEACSVGVHKNNLKDEDCQELADDLRCLLIATISRLTELASNDKKLARIADNIKKFSQRQ